MTPLPPATGNPDALVGLAVVVVILAVFGLGVLTYSRHREWWPPEDRDDE
jgi:hypothetical protein